MRYETQGIMKFVYMTYLNTLKVRHHINHNIHSKAILFAINSHLLTAHVVCFL